MTPPLVMLLACNDPNYPPGAATRTDGWPLFNRGVYTLSVHLQSFVGKVIIEAALAADPGDADWFEVYSVIGTRAGSHTYGTTITGRFPWMRVRLDTVMGPLSGSVDKVLLR